MPWLLGNILDGIFLDAEYIYEGVIVMAILPKKAYGEFEPLISPLVQAIHKLGVWTEGSCEGHLEEGKRPYPYVLIDSWSPDKLVELQRRVGRWNSTHGKEWIFMPSFYSDGCGTPHYLRLMPREDNSERDFQLLC